MTVTDTAPAPTSSYEFAHDGTAEVGDTVLVHIDGRAFPALLVESVDNYGFGGDVWTVCAFTPAGPVTIERYGFVDPNAPEPLTHEDQTAQIAALQEQMRLLLAAQAPPPVAGPAATSENPAATPPAAPAFAAPGE